MRQKLIIFAKVKPTVDLDELKKFGFNWCWYDEHKGVRWTKGEITIYSFDRNVVYKKLTQEVLEDILKLCCSGMLVILRPR